ncbi:perilipin-3-like isoform X2 [Mauremys mutica]|uniref:perilipin-3-like isoform X2 n=1 Tax=Mauremys mutica TaxID=74926 RepID=UPI001D16EA57|nr:perilipin-3-like isoform X2 [Mauremys mutica]
MSENKSQTPVADTPESREHGQQNVVSRVANMPLVSSACDLVSMAYTSTKECHPHIRALCDVAAKGVKTMTEATIGCAQPVLTKLKPQIAAANEFACKGLDKLEEKLPILQQPTDKVLLDAKELVTGTRDAMNSRVTEVLDKTMEAAKSAVTSSMSTVMGSRLGLGAVSRAEAVRGKSADMVDHSLPITDDELAKLSASVKGFEVASVEQQQKYFVHLGSLSTELRQCAYLQSMGKVRLLHQSMQENLSQIQHIIDLIQNVKQSVGKKLHQDQQKLHQLWLEWTKKELAVIDKGSAQPEVDALVLVMSWRITQQLQTMCLNLVIIIQGLPTSVQDKMQQAHHNLHEVHAVFSKASSFQGLSTSILTCSKQKLLKAQEYVDELLEYVVHNAHLSWLVGPFTSCGRTSVELQHQEDHRMETD